MTSLLREERPSAAVFDTLRKPGGHMCTSCARATPAEPHTAEFCKMGAKATIWDRACNTCGPEFFGRHGMDLLWTMTDHDLDEATSLTQPQQAPRPRAGRSFRPANGRRSDR